MRALLYSSNLPPAFFDLSSREAGTVLQKLRNYRFGIFESREAALEWLGS